MINKFKTFEIKNVQQVLGGHSITAQVTVNKAKMADKAMQKMTQYISS
ncbi:hypothetical protein H2O64_22780 [Kordia sp. YSTF-M3]|uniref:Bacteriocin n=1 Tax=Kordia aestuariivivens TaxID=2759037 RepID=A0ABR7QG80_9FLAO|nr:hypothetical protein [Kordia aestuariivivens]MBC8757513.1 hypothetical protein [Kordia aestuariivivens]